MIIGVSTTVSVLAIIGLVVGLVVLVAVIGLLNGTLAPLRAVLADVKDAQTAPMLERGIPGTDQLAQTRRLADSVPDLALRYLGKISAGGIPAPYSPPPAAYSPTAAAPPPPPPPPPPPGAAVGGREIPAPSVEPAWKRYRT